MFDLPLRHLLLFEPFFLLSRFEFFTPFLLFPGDVLSDLLIALSDLMSSCFALLVIVEEATESPRTLTAIIFDSVASKSSSPSSPTTLPLTRVGTRNYRQNFLSLLSLWNMNSEELLMWFLTLRHQPRLQHLPDVSSNSSISVSERCIDFLLPDLFIVPVPYRFSNVEVPNLRRLLLIDNLLCSVEISGESVSPSFDNWFDS